MVVLTTAQALGAASPPIIISLGGLIGQQLSSTPALATLPVSLFNLGLALGTLPAAFLMRRCGRQAAYMIGALVAIIGALVAFAGVYTQNFTTFCLGTLIAGYYAANVQSYRFAATDSATEAQRAKAISWVMIGGLIAAVVGPQTVIWTRNAFGGVPFAGSFLAQAVLAILAMIVLTRLRPTAPHTPQPTDAPARSVGEMLRTPRFLLALASGLVTYGLMVFVMTAAPIAMVGHGHGVDAAALGIQWHVLAMFLPSLVTSRLMARFGTERMTAAGLVIIGLSAIAALGGFGLVNFYGSLVLLGIGWNFGFIGSTAMLTAAHAPSERARAQGLNDFVIFGTVAIASFSSGALLNASGWVVINWMIFPAIALVLAPLVWRIGRKTA
ncbi:major facilitator transporter [Ketogulonicigenium robustum]|uniref:Major facilitator transporter n=1 Tax=Ketogulonicigenium robustum TaxID=92947 RepID=A0A1W6NWT4_9RHOB|nr:major facilitator transporter [Ketogulonicigenium robustum]